MASPRFWSKDDPAYFVDGTKVKAHPGNWKQYPGGEPLHDPRYIVRWWVDGQPWRAVYDPIQHRDSPDRHYVGEGDFLIDVAKFYAPGVHHVVFQVWAGNFFEGWGDTPEDWIEWGGGSNLDENIPYVVGLTVDVDGPPLPTAQEIRDSIIELAESWEGTLPAPAPLSRITIAKRIAQLDDTAWYAVRGEIKGLLDSVGAA